MSNTSAPELVIREFTDAQRVDLPTPADLRRIVQIGRPGDVARPPERSHELTVKPLASVPMFVASDTLKADVATGFQEGEHARRMAELREDEDYHFIPVVGMPSSGFIDADLDEE